MRRILAVALGAALLVPAMAGDKKPKDPEGYTWETSYDQAKLKAAEKTTLLFLDFYTES